MVDHVGYERPGHPAQSRTFLSVPEDNERSLMTISRTQNSSSHPYRLCSFPHIIPPSNLGPFCISYCRSCGAQLGGRAHSFEARTSDYYGFLGPSRYTRSFLRQALVSLYNAFRVSISRITSHEPEAFRVRA